VVQTQQVIPESSIDGTKLGPIVDTGNSGVLSTNDVTNSLRFWAGESYQNRYSAPFRVYKDGSLVATSATISGSITATTGSIGGFNIGSGYIRDSANSFGLASTVTGGDDVRFWAGDTFANRASAPFRVTEAGVFTATTGSFAGSVTIGTGGNQITINGSTGVISSTGTTSWSLSGNGNFTLGALANTVFLKPNWIFDGTAIASSAGDANTLLRLGQVIVNWQTTVNLLTINVSAVNTAGSLAIGLYSQDGQTQYFGFTTATINATGGFTHTLSSPVTLNPGIYYLVRLNVGTADLQTTMWQKNASASLNPFFNGVAGKAILQGTLTVTASTLPTTFDPTAITSAGATTLMTRIDT
jgi:hypothetical protein